MMNAAATRRTEHGAGVAARRRRRGGATGRGFGPLKQRQGVRVGRLPPRVRLLPTFKLAKRGWKAHFASFSGGLAGPADNARGQSDARGGGGGPGGSDGGSRDPGGS